MSENKSRVSQYALIAAFGGFVFGLDAANISGAIKYVSSLFELDSIEQGTLVGIALIGVIVALFFTGTLCEKFGRARVLLSIGIIYALSSIISATAINFEILLFGRFIGGVAFASITVSAMYIGEIAPADSRGKYVSVNQFMIGLGLLVAFIINYFIITALPSISWLTPENVWRYMLGAELIANAVWIALLLRIPESPRWLIKKGRVDEAKDVFGALYADHDDTKHITEIESSLKKESSDSTFTQLHHLFSKPYRAVVILAVVYAIVQGATGMNVVLFFAPLVFEQVGMSVEDTFFQTIITGAVGLAATVIAILLVEKVGRRILTLVGLALIVVAHTSIWAGFSQTSYHFDSVTIASIKTQLAEEDVDLTHLDHFEGQIFETDVELKTKIEETFSKKDAPLVKIGRASCRERVCMFV